MWPWEIELCHLKEVLSYSLIMDKLHSQSLLQSLHSICAMCIQICRHCFASELTWASNKGQWSCCRWLTLQPMLKAWITKGWILDWICITAGWKDHHKPCQIKVMHEAKYTSRNPYQSPSLGKDSRLAKLFWCDVSQNVMITGHINLSHGVPYGRVWHG